MESVTFKEVSIFSSFVRVQGLFCSNVLKLEVASMSARHSTEDPNPDKSLTADGTPNEPGVPGVLGT